MKKRLAPRRGAEFLINGWLSFCGALALFLFAALSSQPARAQVAFGSMVGNVTDPTGAGVAAASVKITLVQTNESRTVETNETGGYTISTVVPGVYKVEVARTGFRTFVAEDILVNLNNVVRVDAQLQVGAQTETIEVTATVTAALQTERADVH